MKYMVRAEQHPSTDDATRARLYAAIDAFYRNIPAEVVLECDYVRTDRRGSYSVLDVPERAVLDAILAPFAGLVRLEVVEVLPSSVAPKAALVDPAGG